MNNFGTQVKEIRDSRNITQTELAERIGRSQCEVSRIEAGRREIKVETLIAIASALGVSAADLDERLAA